MLVNIENLIGSNYDDTFTGNGYANTLDGGDGIDTASHADSAAGVTVNLAIGTGSGGSAAGDTLAKIENLIGSSHGDKLIGDWGDNTLIGQGDRDTLNGGDGKDVLDGGTDGDFLIGGLGSDSFIFGVGFGTDVVKSFDDGKGVDQDVICFDQNVFADFAAVQSAMSQVGTSVYITVDTHNYIELIGTSLKQFGADDFAFF